MSVHVVSSIKQKTNVWGDDNGKIESFSTTEVATPYDLTFKLDESKFNRHLVEVSEIVSNIKEELVLRASTDDLELVKSEISVLKETLTAEERILQEKEALGAYHKVLISELEDSVRKEHQAIQQEVLVFKSLRDTSDIENRIKPITARIDTVLSRIAVIKEQLDTIEQIKKSIDLQANAIKEIKGQIDSDFQKIGSFKNSLIDSINKQKEQDVEINALKEELTTASEYLVELSEKEIKDEKRISSTESTLSSQQERVKSIMSRLYRLETEAPTIKSSISLLTFQLKQTSKRLTWACVILGTVPFAIILYFVLNALI